jgi:hypothetical protein
MHCRILYLGLQNIEIESEFTNMLAACFGLIAKVR